jgi:acid phosphatase (class A)
MAPLTIRRISVCLLLFSLVGCATSPPPAREIPEIRPGILMGYLPREDYPDSLALLPAPPAPGSPAQAHDDAVSEGLLALEGSERWRLATQDNALAFPGAAATFACAVDAPITEADTPSLYLLLRRSLTDAGLSTYGAKNSYERTRPFVVNGAPICATDAERQMLAGDGSYPSGHTAIGWAWALILAELVPDRADAILRRGYEFGVSRLVCNVHWYSDTVAGRTIAAAVVARLHASPEFAADLEAAGKELAAVREGGLPPNRDCAIEAAALSGSS